jgi:hypothetical protein
VLVVVQSLVQVVELSWVVVVLMLVAWEVPLVEVLVAP